MGYTFKIERERTRSGPNCLSKDEAENTGETQMVEPCTHLIFPFSCQRIGATSSLSSRSSLRGGSVGPDGESFSFSYSFSFSARARPRPGIACEHAPTSEADPACIPSTRTLRFGGSFTPSPSRRASSSPHPTPPWPERSGPPSHLARGCNGETSLCPRRCPGFPAQS